MDNPILLTIREFCQLTKIKKTKTYELIGAGAIPAIKIGRATRISMSAVDLFLKSCPPVRTINRAPQKIGSSVGTVPPTGNSARTVGSAPNAKAGLLPCRCACPF